MKVFARFNEVLQPAGARTALLASIVGRLSLSMTGLGVLLLVKQSTGSYAQAGLVSAAYALSFAIASPMRARAADRRGPSVVLRLCAVLHPLSFVALLALAAKGAPGLLLAASAVAMGFTVPPLGSVMRALWGRLLPPEGLHAAFALESIVVELCFVIGPLLVALLTAIASPAWAVAASAVAAASGAYVLAGVPVVRASEPHADRPSHVLGPLVSPSVRALLVNVLLIGVGFGSIELGILAFVEEQHHSGSVAGVVLALWSVGSIVGGLVYGGLRLKTPPAVQLPLLVTFVGLAAALPILAPSVLVLSLLVIVSGSSIAPWSTCNSVLLGEAAPTGTVTEVFAWSGSMIFSGAALGTAIAGVLADHSGSRAAFAVGAVTGGLAIISAWVGRRTVAAQPV